jgi:CHAD domain-containing protein
MRYEYTLPDGVGAGDFADALCRQFSFHDLGGRRWEVCYFDTFDWRLFGSGFVLEEHRHGGSRHLHWRAVRHGSADRILQNAQMPHFAHELPSGAFRERLERFTEPRALLPQAIIHTQAHALNLENEDGKTLLRVVVEVGRLLNCHQDASAPIVSRRVRLEPLRGYERKCLAVRRAVEKLGLQPAPCDMLLEVLAFSGRKPRSISGRPKVALLPDQRTDEAAKVLLSRMVGVINANLPGVRARTDCEFLHDLRTAVRRMRALLGELDDVYPKRLLARYRRELKWLGGITGRARDLDVLALAFDDYKAMLTGDDAHALEPCRDFVASELTRAYRDLEEQLTSARFERLMNGLQEFLEAPVPRRTPLANAMTDVHRFADRRLWKRCRKLRRAARVASRGDDVEALHRCRILAKRTRYLLDAFESLYPADKVRKLRNRLKGLQDELGALNDVHVHEQALLDLTERMRIEEALSDETAGAVSRLCEQLARRQSDHVAQAARQLDEWAGKSTDRLCRRLFHPA